MTDEERIAKRKEAVNDLKTLASYKVLKLDSKIALHEECSGTGETIKGKCVYCGGSGRVIYYTANTVVPFE